jgi:hypothetical protein
MASDAEVRLWSLSFVFGKIVYGGNPHIPKPFASKYTTYTYPTTSTYIHHNEGRPDGTIVPDGRRDEGWTGRRSPSVRPEAIWAGRTSLQCVIRCVNWYDVLTA